MKIHLALAVATFVLLDLGTLAFSYSIAHQVEQDAVAINLAGRQRMLSQRITKAALLAVDQNRNAGQRAASVLELTQADLVFRKTLSAFAVGGETVSGNGQPVQLQSVQGRAARLIGEVRGALEQWPKIPSDLQGLARFSQFMNEQNGAILDSMNQLTTELERESIATVARLRIAQTFAFVLSFVNFVFILWHMRRAKLAAEAASFTDALCGLLNRAGLYRELQNAIDKRLTQQTPLGVMLLDLNDFKAVNDSYGHAAGDAALREVARRLQAFCRVGWVCGRLGGDEFAVVCPGIASEELTKTAKRLSDTLSGIPVGGLTVSASVGWASIESEKTTDDVFAVADAKMYSIKNSTRITRSYRNKPR